MSAGVEHHLEPAVLAGPFYLDEQLAAAAGSIASWASTTRETLMAWLQRRQLRAEDWLFPRRSRRGGT